MLPTEEENRDDSRYLIRTMAVKKDLQQYFSNTESFPGYVAMTSF
jgi:hypothetical protein